MNSGSCLLEFRRALYFRILYFINILLLGLEVCVEGMRGIGYLDLWVHWCCYWLGLEAEFQALLHGLRLC
ncbi:hypothetical protein RJT34_27244 [Clitoria ternatea]|uniref:Uncharacterized protein n=1 Tax=Clitoria ternatea TaxID=43366 RepID=A0AAN9I8F9_CLITE